MDLYAEYRDRILKTISSLTDLGTLPPGMDISRVSVGPPREVFHGDITTNAALVLAKMVGMKPRDLAECLSQALQSDKSIKKVEIAGPGFLNLWLEHSVWYQVLQEALKSGLHFGTSSFGVGKKINLEFVSANPTGPLHIGHARGTVFGDVLASLLEKVGYEVCREYYINDAGSQVDSLARSAHLRYREALGEDIGEIPEGLYPGEYMIPVGKALVERDGKKWLTLSEYEWLEPIRNFAINEMMDLIKKDLEMLGVHHDVFTSEREFVDAGVVDAVLSKFEERGMTYEGTLEPPKGKIPEDWEPRPQTLFRATEFGDDVDRPLKKSDGSWTYFASDVGYHWNKYKRGFSELINVWGADHSGYVQRMVAATGAITENKACLDIKICQIVRLLENGVQLRMSKRTGNFVTLRDLVEEVGPGVVRFIMLTRKNDAPLDFDFGIVREKSRENPVFYVQYAHARCNSVIRMARDLLPEISVATDTLTNADFSLLSDESEVRLIKEISYWPYIVESAAAAHEPHRLAYYLFELASSFHGLWTKGSREDRSLRMIRQDNAELTRSRLALVRATQIVIASGLSIFGVEPLEELR